MPTLLQPDRLGSSSWADDFPSRAGNLHELFGEQSWRPDQYQSDVQSLLVDVSSCELEAEDASERIWQLNISSISASPEAVRLRRNLRTHKQDLAAKSRGTSILDFPRLNLGEILRPLGPDDDLLGEMMADEVRS
jgi:hypothetical protein